MTKTAIKERPILFSGPMVRAILDGRKTQTRRIVKAKDADPMRCIPLELLMKNIVEWREKEGRWFGIDGWDTLVYCDCPYKIGSRLWVREIFSFPVPGCEVQNGYTYRADHVDKKHGDGPTKITWKPSIHMPRNASRITLEITAVRVERLQAISNADCVAEGIEPIGAERNIGDCLGRNVTTQAGRIDGKCSTVRQLYSELWTTINGPGSWAANPWIWVVSFERLSYRTGKLPEQRKG